MFERGKVISLIMDASRTVDAKKAYKKYFDSKKNYSHESDTIFQQYFKEIEEISMRMASKSEYSLSGALDRFNEIKKAINNNPNVPVTMGDTYFVCMYIMFGKVTSDAEFNNAGMKISMQLYTYTRTIDSIWEKNIAKGEPLKWIEDN